MMGAAMTNAPKSTLSPVKRPVSVPGSTSARNPVAPSTVPRTAPRAVMLVSQLLENDQLEPVATTAPNLPNFLGRAPTRISMTARKRTPAPRPPATGYQYSDSWTEFVRAKRSEAGLAPVPPITIIVPSIPGQYWFMVTVSIGATEAPAASVIGLG